MSKRKPLTSITITVDGFGKVPRMNMIAPINTPFSVDLNTLNAIMKAPNMKAYVVSPIDKHKVEINMQNADKIKRLYQGWLMMADAVEAEKIEAEEKAKMESIASEEDKRVLEFVKSKNPALADAPVITESVIDKAINGAFEKVITPPPVKEDKNNSPIKSVESVAIREGKKDNKE